MPIKPSENCAVCHDSGWLRRDLPPNHPDFGKLVRCQCRHADDLQRIQQLSRMTDTERALTLEHIQSTGGDTDRMIAAARQFIDHPAGILTIAGSCGNAKSVALCAIVNQLLGRGRQAIYITLFDILSDIKQAFDKAHNISNMSAYQRLQQYEDIKILAIDEFDKVKLTDWAIEQITDLIDRRHRYGIDRSAGTVIAMNGSIFDLPDWIASRLQDGQNRLIVNNDPDLRPYLKPKEYPCSL